MQVTSEIKMFTGASVVRMLSISCCCTEISVFDQVRCDLNCQISKHISINTIVLEVSLYDYVQPKGPFDDNEFITNVCLFYVPSINFHSY